MIVCGWLRLGFLLLHTLLLLILGSGLTVESLAAGCTNARFPVRDRLVGDIFQSSGSVTLHNVIPEMNFTCNGTITGYTFAGRMASGDQNPTIQIWRQNCSHPGEYYRTGSDIVIDDALCEGGFTEVFDRVFHCDLMDTAHRAVQPGDVLGLELAQRSNDAIDLLFARVIRGPINYVFPSSSLRIVISESDSVNQNLPQITFQVSENDCTRGFPTIPVSSDISIAQASSTVTVLIPDMNFTCNLTIVAFTVAAANRQGDQDPMIQIWRENSSQPGQYYKIDRPISVNNGLVVCADGLTTIDSASTRHYWCILNKEFQTSVESGDILGLEIPPTEDDDFDIWFTRGGPPNYVFDGRLNSTVVLSENTTVVQQLPQISFGFTSDQCTGSGFPDIVSPSGGISQGDTNNVTTRLFPELKFGCSGKIVRVTVAVVNRSGQQKPKIQIWRLSNTQLSDTYYKSGLDIPIVDNSTVCRRHRRSDGVFRCTLNEAYQVPVQPGNILGLELPPKINDNFDIYFIEPGPLNFVFEGSLTSTANLSEASRVTSHMPQINFTVMLDFDASNRLPSTTTCDFTPVVQAPTTISVPTTPKGVGSIIAGSVIGLSIVLLLLFVVFVLMLVVCIRRHRTTMKGKHNLIILVDKEEAYGDSNYIGVSDHMESNLAYGISDIDNHMNENQAYKVKNRIAGEEQIPVDSNKAYGTSSHVRPGDHVDSNKAYGVLSQQTFAQQELVSQMYMYDYPINEVEAQDVSKRFPWLKLREPILEDDTYWEPADDVNELYQQLSANKYRDIKSSQIQITEVLGSGQFGTVSKGIWQSPAGAMDVAVKQLQPGASEEENIKFLQEAAINGQFRHPNIVQLMGVVTDERPALIVLELLSNGDLLNFLINQRPSPGEAAPAGTQRMLQRFCQHVAFGMSYLASKSFIHRDLAARNILVSEDRICKISDFGMSRDVEGDKCYISKGGKIPVKWTAPEAIQYKKYSTASDVWSFGCVMYEIWSLGHEPFERFTNTETFRRVEAGYRLPPPPGLTKELYKIMIQCWQPESSRRPTFPQLVEMLSRADFELFAWEEEDIKDSDPQVKLIGAPMELAQDLYPELQRSYNK